MSLHAGTSQGGLGAEIGTGNVSGPASSTANFIATWADATGRTLLNSSASVVSGSVIAGVDDAYSSTWNGSLTLPTKNAVYDKIEALGGVTVGSSVVNGTPSTLLYVDSNTAVANGTTIPFGFSVSTGVLSAIGNLGVGTNTPVATEPGSKFTVESADNTALIAGTLNNTGSGQTVFIMRRTGGTAARWYFYIPTGSGDFRFFQGADLFSFTNGGIFRATGSLTLGSQATIPDLSFERESAAVGRIGGSTNAVVGVVKHGLLVTATTTALALATTASGIVYTNEGASGGAVNFTLPTATARLTYSFVVQNSDGLQVTAAAGDTIQLGTSISTTAGNALSTTIGSAINIVAINNTAWMAQSVVGTWVVT